MLEAELGSLRDELASRTTEYTTATERFQHAQDELRRLHDQIHQAWADQLKREARQTEVQRDAPEPGE